MIAYIVCEGNLDVQLLKHVLPAELLENVEIVAGCGISAAKSLARSLLVRRQLPVAIVADADSVDPDLIQERLKNIKESIESVSVILVKVILAVPAVEIIFFQDIFLLSRLLGYAPPKDILDLASFQPRKALEQLIAQSQKSPDRSHIINQLASEDLEILHKSPVIQEVLNFLQFVKNTAIAS